MHGKNSTMRVNTRNMERMLKKTQASKAARPGIKHEADKKPQTKLQIQAVHQNRKGISKTNESNKDGKDGTHNVGPIFVERGPQGPE